MTNATPARPLHAPLDEYVRQVEDLKRDAGQLAEGLSDSQLNWSPGTQPLVSGAMHRPPERGGQALRASSGDRHRRGPEWNPW